MGLNIMRKNFLDSANLTDHPHQIYSHLLGCSKFGQDLSETVLLILRLRDYHHHPKYLKFFTELKTRFSFHFWDVPPSSHFFDDMKYQNQWFSYPKKLATGGKVFDGQVIKTNQISSACLASNYLTCRLENLPLPNTILLKLSKDGMESKERTGTRKWIMAGIIAPATKFTACVTVIKKPQRFTTITKNQETNIFLIDKSAYLVCSKLFVENGLNTPNKSPFALFGMFYI